MKNYLIAFLLLIPFFSYSQFSGEVITDKEHVYHNYHVFKGDLDKDGSTDLICVGFAKVFVHWSSTDYKSARQEFVVGPPGAYVGATRSISDMNHDGKYDIVFVGTHTWYFTGQAGRKFDLARYTILNCKNGQKACNGSCRSMMNDEICCFNMEPDKTIRWSIRVRPCETGAIRQDLGKSVPGLDRIY